MYNEVIRTEVINQRLEKSIQTEVINQRSEKSIQTEVINQRSEKSIQTEVRSCHKDKNQSCRSQNEDGEIYNQTEHRSLLFTFSPLLFTFLHLLLNFTVQVYVSLGQYFYLLLRQYLEVSMETVDKFKISDATIRNRMKPQNIYLWMKQIDKPPNYLSCGTLYGNHNRMEAH